MANQNFGYMAGKQDARYFGSSQEDVTVSGELEGGYTHTRPRTTRKPRRTFDTGFTNISQAELEHLEDLYDAVGGHTPIDYVHPITGVTHVVRIKSWPKAAYRGIGSLARWDVATIELKEV